MTSIPPTPGLFSPAPGLATPAPVYTPDNMKTAALGDITNTLALHIRGRQLSRIITLNLEDHANMIDIYSMSVMI